MGIQKIGHKVSGVSSSCRATNYHFNIRGAEMKYDPASEASGDDSDDCDIAEANCEPAMVGGQTCSIPYELYDLPDLKGILSIETWNSFLTEEERFFLSSYLPDMDQQTFNLTMEELLGGSNLYYGNPVDRFYKQLRGGLYPPKVACCRECLIYVQRKWYYYSLRSYHENMGRTFTDMRRLWDQCGKESGINERLLLWSKRRQSQSLRLPDLNRVPSEETIMDTATTCVLPGKSKLWETTRSSKGTFRRLDLKGDSKGILKTKAFNNRVFRNRSPKVVLVEPRYQSAPKGLLKVISKSPSMRVEEPDVAPRHDLDPTRADADTSQDQTLIPSPASACTGTALQKARGSKLNKPAELPKCVLNRQDNSDIVLGTSQSSVRRLKKETDPLLDDRADAEQETLLRQFGVPNFFRGQHLCTNQEEYVPVYPRFPNLKEKILDTDSGTKETTTGSSTRPKNSQNDTIVRKPLSILSRGNETDGIKDDHLFCLTYKRRKVRRIHVA